MIWRIYADGAESRLIVILLFRQLWKTWLPCFRSAHMGHSLTPHVYSIWLIILQFAPSDAVAPSLILTYVTAYQMLHRTVKIQRGQRILVHGTDGAVGIALLQLDKLLDLELYGTGSVQKMPIADAAKAHELIDKAAVKGKIVLIVNQAE